jgi:hypothetical protein
VVIARIAAATAPQNKPIANTRAKVAPVRIPLRNENRFRRYAHEPLDATLTAVIIKISRITFVLHQQ